MEISSRCERQVLVSTQRTGRGLKVGSGGNKVGVGTSISLKEELENGSFMFIAGATRTISSSYSRNGSLRSQG